jgi:hypothetical protein
VVCTLFHKSNSKVSSDEQFRDPTRQHFALFFWRTCGHNSFEVFCQELNAVGVERFGLGLQEGVNLGMFVVEFIFLVFQGGQFIKQGSGVATFDDGVGQAGDLPV